MSINPQASTQQGKKCPKLTPRNSILLLLTNKFIHIPQPIARRLLETVNPIIHTPQLLRPLAELLLHVLPVALVLFAG